MSKTLSKTFILASFICTLLVICIHYNSLHYYTEINLKDGFFFIQLYLVSGLSRVAVPFFALASGFFLFLNLKPTASSYTTEVSKRIRTIALPYIIAVLVITIFKYAIFNIKSNEANDAFEITVSTILAPDAVQLWYIRDLFFLVLISPAIYVLCNKLGSLAIYIALILWGMEIQIFPKLDRWYFISIETFCFFTIGCFLSSRISALETRLKLMSPFSIAVVTLIYMGTFIMRVTEDPTFNNWYSQNYTPISLLLHKIGILSGLLCIFSICYRINSDRMYYLAQYNFFVYLYHVTPLSNIIFFFWHKLSDNEVLFYFTAPSAIISCYAIATILQRIAPSLYNLMSGGRNARS